MAKRIIHLSIDVRGVLNWSDKDLKKLFKTIDGKKPTARVIRNFLYDQLADGWEVIPYGEMCEGFDKKTGCPGHEVFNEPENHDFSYPTKPKEL